MALENIVLARAIKSLGLHKKADTRSPDGRATSDLKSDKHQSTAQEVQAWVESSELRPPQ